MKNTTCGIRSTKSKRVMPIVLAFATVLATTSASFAQTSDVTPPTAKCKNIVVNISCNPISFSDYWIFDNGSYDNAGGSGIKSITIDPGSNTSFSCANAGSNNVVLLVKDNAGNTATCTSKVHVNCFKPTCLITPDATPFGTYPGLTGNGTPGNPYLLYLGHGPASVTLAGPASSGAATISNYTWSYSSSTAGASASVIPCTPSGSAACNTAVFTPTAEGIYTIQLSITSQDPEGKETCSSTCSITICVRDIRYEDDDDLDEPGDEPADDDPMSIPANAAPNAKKKIVMCHWDASKSKFKTMKVASINVSTHLSHGDYLGKCNKKCGDLKKKKKPANTSRMAGSQVITDGNLKMVLFPNPTSKDFHITLQGNDATSADIFVYDLTGRIIEQYLAQSVNTEISVGTDLTPGIYMIGVRHDGQLRMAKVVKQ